MAAKTARLRAKAAALTRNMPAADDGAADRELHRFSTHGRSILASAHDRGGGGSSVGYSEGDGGAGGDGELGERSGGSESVALRVCGAEAGAAVGVGAAAVGGAAAPEAGSAIAAQMAGNILPNHRIVLGVAARMASVGSTRQRPEFAWRFWNISSHEHPP